MRGERWILRAGEGLVRWAAGRLPSTVRDERYREWSAELPVILHDPGTRPAVRRAVHTLAFALDTTRAATLGRDVHRYQGTHQGKPDPIGLILATLFLLPPMLLGVLAYLGWITYQAIFGANWSAGATLVATNVLLGVFILVRRRSIATDDRWYLAAFISVGAGILLRGLAHQLGWGHPLLFALLSYGGYAIFAGCLAAMAKHYAALIRTEVRSAASGKASS